jgi:hypothetical protein
LKLRFVSQEWGNPCDERLRLIGREVIGVRFARRPAFGDMDDITVAGRSPDQIQDAVFTRTRAVGRRTQQQVDEFVRPFQDGPSLSRETHTSLSPRTPFWGRPSVDPLRS